MAPPLATPAATGTADCTAGAACESGVCLLDATGVSRCCEADCRAAGRVCSALGICACPAATEEVGGECLLRAGERCRQASDCAGNRCVDDVCCDTSCERVCERCDAPEREGECVLDAEDSSCGVANPGFVCVEPGRCRLPDGESCGVAADCDSENCEPGRSGERLCCERSCEGVCERCGTDGACDDFPETDVRCESVDCPESTACVEYHAPAAGACASPGTCARCEATFARAALPCGVGKQCDGGGRCELTGIGSVAAGARHTCAILPDGDVMCWGSNAAGQLGAVFDRSRVGDDEALVDVELELDFDEDAVALTAGYAHTCALFADGSVRCWGVGDEVEFAVSVPALLGVDAGSVAPNEFGFVDPRSVEDVHLPEPAVQISAGPSGSHTCAVLASGGISCWGANDLGQCGTGDTVTREVGSGKQLPEIDLGGARAVAVSAADVHTCALLEGGSVSCWGEGHWGRLGYGSSADRSRPEGAVLLGEPAYQVAAASTFTCALLARGRVRCWGYNSDGQLGYGHAQIIGDDETPYLAATTAGPPGRELLGGDVPVGGGEGVVQLVPVVDSRGMCARFAGGAVRCWGENSHGELGYGHALSFGAAYTPDELAGRPMGARYIGGDLDLGGAAMALAEGGRCALLAPQAGGDAPSPLYCWGMNQFGQLGVPAHFPDGSLTLTPSALGPVELERHPE